MGTFCNVFKVVCGAPQVVNFTELVQKSSLPFSLGFPLQLNFMTVLDGPNAGKGRQLLGIPSRKNLKRVLQYMLDESEFLSDYGIRSLSKVR